MATVSSPSSSFIASTPIETTTVSSYLATHNRLQRTIIWIVVICVLCSCVLTILRRWKYIHMTPRAVSSMPLQKYHFHTGDIIIVSTETRSQGLFNMSVVIKFFCATPWNHVGVVYVDPHTHEPFLWEMVGSGLVRLIPISDIPDDPFAARYYVRSINRRCDSQIMQRVMNEQWRDIFNYDVMMPWFSRHLDTVTCANGVRWFNGRQKTCSQLTAELYHALGIMDFYRTGIDVSELFPSDYVADLPAPIGRNDITALPMVNGAQFGPLIELTFDRRPNVRSKAND